METEIDYPGVANALRARGHDARLEGGGAAPTYISVPIAQGRSTWWDADEKAWFASIVEADGDPDESRGLEVTSVTWASDPEDVADAITTAVRGL